MAPITRHHAEWLSLMDVSGPFLSIPVLKDVFPNGLDSHDSMIAAELRAAHDAWSDPAAAGYDDAEAVHRAFVDFVLERVLGFRKGDLLRDAERLKTDFATSVPMQPAQLTPDLALMVGETARLLITVSTPSIPVDQPVPGSGWSATPRERMVEMLRGTGCALGLVTDGERWTVVSRREGEAPGYATWWASLWREEKITLQSFRTLLGAHRFFSVPDDESLAGLLDRSAEDQSEVTTKLGNQTLEAVEILVRTLDQLDRDRGGELLRDMPEPELYDAAVTVMMRLVVLFFAEENDLLPMSEDLWVSQYAASSLRSRLQRAADEGGEEVLEAHSDAWPRLLATWRAVYGGVEHGNMRLAPYGGSLFDPDRYPFLEGRLPGTTWQDADPLPVDNRTVLHLLNALQTLQEGGQRRKLSFRALDVEQIGHVYEGMLDHTAARAGWWVLGLSGTGGKEPEIQLEELEALEDEALVTFLSDRTGRNAATIRQWLAADTAEEVKKRFGTHWAPAFSEEPEAAKRIQRFAKFLRVDSLGAPTVFQPGSVYVCDSSHRGATGTHYTPRSFTEEIITETLDPLVYDGIAEGKPETEWKLRTPPEILELNVGDPACGSGAFLVQACRYLSAKLVESRRAHGELDHDPTEEDLIYARREVAGRCLYGVDVNPMAVEMAKLSLWLVTLERDKPFSFLDHAIGLGDSLVGLTSLDQLRYWSLSGERDPQEMIAGIIGEQVEQALELRQKLEASPVFDIHDLEYKQRLLDDAKKATELQRGLADLLFAPSFASDNPTEVAKLRDDALHFATHHLDDAEALAEKASPQLKGVRPFHWVLEFPEVFERGGFDAVVGNPPFLGGDRISGHHGSPYAAYLKDRYEPAQGRVDLCVFFLRLVAESLVVSTGQVGVILTDTSSMTANRRAGFDVLLRRVGVRTARTGVPWPPAPGRLVSIVHLSPLDWRGRKTLNGEDVQAIGPGLTSGPDPSQVTKLDSPVRFFSGAKLYGASFVRTSTELKVLSPENPGLLAYARRFVNGDVINGTPECDDSRIVIDFGERELKEIEGCDGVIADLTKRVKAERANQTKQIHEHRPWLLWDKRTSSFELARHRERVFCLAADSTHLIVRACDPAWLFNQKIRVFITDRWHHYAVLQSPIHEAWIYFMGGSRGAAISYSTRNVTQTFAWPSLRCHQRLDQIGEAFHTAREGICRDEGVGPIEVHHWMAATTHRSRAVIALGSLYRELASEVWSAYGEAGAALALEPRRFGRTTRLFLDEPSQELVTRRLFELNAEAAAR